MRFRSAGERTLVMEAKKNGWNPIGRNGQNHLILQHTSGIETRIPSKIHTKPILRAARLQLSRLAPWK